MITLFLRRLGRTVSTWKQAFLKRRPKHTHTKILRTAKGKRMPRFSQLRQVGRIFSREERILFQVATTVLVISVFWLGASIIRGYRVEVPAVGGTYIEAAVGSPELVNPLFATLNDADRDVVELVYSGLMRFDKNQRLVPDLAAKVSVNETETVYTFSLREDVIWHDEEPFTSEDVIFTFNMIQDEAVGSPLYVTFRDIAVEAVDDYTVTFTLEEPFAPFLQSLTIGMLPEHYWFDVQPERFALTQKNLQPIGTGPYMFSKLAKDTTGAVYEYELERFARYHREAPFIQNFTFMYYPVYEGEAGAVRSIRQQAVQGLNFVPSDIREQVERKHIVLHTLQLPQYTGLFFNGVREPALADDDVREALAIALDKDRIVREALGGEGQVIEGPVLPGFPGYNPEIEKVPYDITSANELLDDAWPSLTSDAYRELREKELIEQLIAQRTAEQVPVSATSTESTTSTEDVVEEAPEVEAITTSTVAGEVEQILAGEIDPSQTFYRKSDDDVILEIDIVTVDTQEYRDAAALIEASWQEIGVNVNVAFVPAKDFSRTVLKDRSYDVLLYGVILGSDPDQFPFWHSSQVEAPGLNLALYENEDVDELLETARASTDDAEIEEAYTTFQNTLLEDRPAVFLYTPTYTYAQHVDVQGFDVSQIFVPSDRFANVTEWYLRTRGMWKQDAS